MTFDSKTLTMFIGAVYLCVGLSGSIFPTMMLLYVPKSVLISADSLKLFGVLAFIALPCYGIGYAWLRGRKWGWYLLIAYNGFWFMYMTFGFAAQMYSHSGFNRDLVTMMNAVPSVVLGSLIGVAFQDDVRTSMGFVRGQ